MPGIAVTLFFQHLLSRLESMFPIAKKDIKIRSNPYYSCKVFCMTIRCQQRHAK